MPSLLPNLSLLGFEARQPSKFKLSSALDKPMEILGEAMAQMSPREELLTQQMVCLLVANGEEPQAVANKLGISEHFVHKVCAGPKGQDMIVRFQSDLYPDVKLRIKKVAQIALGVQTKLLVNPATPPAVLAKVANEVLDRAHGKATQIIESHNLNFDLKDVQQVEKALATSQEKLRRIEEMQKRLAIPVGRADHPESANAA